MVTKTEATIADLHNAPDDGKYELVNGRLRHMSPTGFRPVRVAGRIFDALFDYEEATGSGMAIGDNLGFIVRQPRLRSFSPDAAYIAGRLEEKDDYGPASDSGYAAKRADYFAAGTQVVWDVSPRERTVARYRVGAPETPHVFLMGEIADAEPALPGWRMALRDIFHS